MRKMTIREVRQDLRQLILEGRVPAAVVGSGSQINELRESLSSDDATYNFLNMRNLREEVLGLPIERLIRPTERFVLDIVEAGELARTGTVRRFK